MEPTADIFLTEKKRWSKTALIVVDDDDGDNDCDGYDDDDDDGDDDDDDDAGKGWKLYVNPGGPISRSCLNARRNAWNRFWNFFKLNINNMNNMNINTSNIFKKLAFNRTTGRSVNL